MKKLVQQARRVSLPLIVLMPWPALAQIQSQTLQLPPQPQQLAATVVSAARVEQPLAEVLPSVTLLTRVDIERSQATSLADLLQGEAGFEFGRNGGPGAVTSFFLRGADSKNLVVMIDGVRALVDGWGNLAAIDLPLQQIERIELLRGNASALYGEAAVGGVLQIFTRALGTQPGAYASATVGSRATREWSAGYAGSAGAQGDVSYRLDLGRASTDGFSAMNPAQNRNVNPDNDGVERSHLSGKIARRLSRDLTVGVSASLTRTDVAFDDAYGLPSDRNLYRRDNSLLNAYAQGQLNANWNSRVDVSRTVLDMRDDKNDVPNRSSFSAGQMQGAQTGLRWFNTYSAAPGTVFNFGMEMSNERYNSDATVSGYQANRQLRGYFAGLSQAFGRFSLQANVRHDVTDVRKEGAAYAADWANTSGLLGAGYRLTDAWRLTGTVSTGFRAPSAGELANNIELRPETHQSREIGMAYAQGRQSFRAVAFDTRTTDAIYWLSVAPYAPVNIGKVRNQGVEVSGTTEWKGTHARYALVSQDPWNESDGTRLARRARQYGSLDVWRRFGVTTAGVKFYAADERYDTSAPDKLLPGYATLAFYAAHPLSQGWTVRAKVENVLDRPYQLAHGYNTPPFGVWLSLVYQQH